MAHISFPSLIKGALLTSLPCWVVLCWLLLFGNLTVEHFLYGAFWVFLLDGLLVSFFLGNIASLTVYVENTAHDIQAETPELGILSAATGLRNALNQMSRAFEKKKRELGDLFTEREILVDSLPTPLILCNEQLRIVRTNGAARAIFGQKLINLPLNDIIPSDKLMDSVCATAKEKKDSETFFHFEDKTQAFDFHATIKCFPYNSSHNISLIVALNDVTALKRVEQMRADFVANASHEIRTPLASIRGFIETLQGPARDDAQARETFLRTMDEQALRMSNLVTDLLSLSKIETNAHSVPHGKVDLSALLRAEKENAKWAAEKKGMRIRLESSDALPFARGEESELAQVVHNLINNAIKYGNPNTEILASVRLTATLPADPHFARQSRALLLSVRDQGEGIKREHIPRLTERFYRVDSARAHSIGGTGLGLAIVKHIVNRHRGALSIESVVGSGSTFSIYLPIYVEEIRTPPPTEP